MNMLLSITVALRAMGANKLRTFLTMLGIVIGVGAVIGLVSIGRGVNAIVTQQIQSIGTNLIFVRPGAVQQGGVASMAGERPTLTYNDALALSDPNVAPAIAGVAPEAGAGAQLVVGGVNVSTRVVGTTPGYQSVRNYQVEIGEFISPQYIDARSRVMVLGSSVAEKLFTDSDPIEQQVRVSMFGRRGVTFRVVGVLKSKGGSGFGNQDDLVIIPITTMQERLLPQRTARGEFNVGTINVQAVNEESIDAAIEQMRAVLRERHRVVEDDFTIQAQREILGALNQATGALTLFLGGIAAISLVVGGIGIMNIMLVSVTERTREIGIRKAVGAKRRDILLQFLVESVTVSIVGGAIGIALGAGLSQVFSQIDLGNNQRLPTLVAGDAVLLAVGVSVVVGLFFGIYPAMRAASLNPIEALRYE